MKRSLQNDEAESADDKRHKSLSEGSSEGVGSTSDNIGSSTVDENSENVKDEPIVIAETVVTPEKRDEKIISDSGDTVGEPEQASSAEVSTEKDASEEPKKTDLRWQLTHTAVKQRMNCLLTTSNLSDCTFVVGKSETQQIFKLHSVIMKMSSPEFEDLLDVAAEVIIPDVEPDVFKQILEYIYLDYINLWSIEKTQALYRASSKFKLIHLSEKAVEFMMNKMNLDNIWPIYDAAIATQDQMLIDECAKYFRKNVTDLLKHSKFSTVDQSVLTSLVEDDGLGVLEADLVHGVLQWATQRCVDLDLLPNLENKRNALGPRIISKLRFLSLSTESFVSQLAYNKLKDDIGLLNLEESYAILLNLIIPQSYPLPDGFCSEVKPRTAPEKLRLNRRIFNPLGNYGTMQQGSRGDRLTVLPGPSLTCPVGTKNFSLEFSVSRSMILHGIQVPTFFPGMITNTPKVYEETYVVTVQNLSKVNKPIATSITWSGKVLYNSMTDIMFKDFIRLDKNVKYSVLVYTSNMYYVNQKLCTVEESSGIKFLFKDTVSLYGKQATPDFGFISQLIYTPLP